MIKQPIAVDVSTTKHEIGRRKPTVGARQRSRSVGKPKQESSFLKQPFKSSIRVNDETHDGDIPLRKHSSTSSQIKKYISLPSSVVDDSSSLASTETFLYENKYRPLRTSSFSGYKSSTLLHKVASSRLSTAVDPGVTRHFEPKTSQYRIGDVHSYKLHDDLDTTDEEPMDTADSEVTDDAGVDADDDDDADADEDEPPANAEGAEGEVPENPEDATGEENENGEGQPGDPDSDGTEGTCPAEEEDTVGKILVKFLVLALICKAVSLFFQPNKCTC